MIRVVTGGRARRARRRSAAALVAALGLLAISGCWSVGPDYTPPERALPASWNAAAPKGTQADEQNAAQANAAWWQALKDPMLDRLIATALADNPDQRLAALRIREARTLLNVAEAGYGPTVNAGGGYTHSLPSRTAGQGGTAHPRDLYQGGFDATWELDIFGGVRREVEAAAADVAGIELAAAAVQVSLTAEVARNYVRLRELQAQTAITGKNLKSQKATAELIKSRIKAGLATDLDLTRITALVATTQAQLPTLEMQRRQTIHRIEVLLGQNPGSLTAELETGGPVPAPPSIIGVGVPSDLLRRRPDIAGAERAIAGASARIGVATSELYPKFSISGNIGLQSAQFSDLGRTTASQYWSFGPSFRWPILNWGRIRASIDAAHVREEESLVGYEKTILGALEEVENALVAFDREQARRADLQQAVDANDRAVLLATELYSKGLSSFIDVLAAQQSQYQAESALVTNEAAISTDAVALFKALGGGWDPTAQPATPTTQTEANAGAQAAESVDSMFNQPAP